MVLLHLTDKGENLISAIDFVLSKTIDKISDNTCSLDFLTEYFEENLKDTYTI